MEKKLKLAWLAGIWDGEGSITVFSNPDYWRVKNHIRGAKKPQLKMLPTICVVNTDLKMIAEIIKILDKYDIRLNIMKRKWKRKENYSDTYQLITRKMSKIKAFLELVHPYLISKKPQAELLLRFVNSRLKNKEEGKKWGHNTPYTEAEREIEREIRELNRTCKGKSSETIRQTL